MIPIATTTITVTREARPATEDPLGEGYDEPEDRDDTAATIAGGVRAVIATGSGNGSKAGGESEQVEFRLTCDPCPLSYLDTVTDDTTGDVYEVRWATETPGVAGLGHVAAGLRTTKGRSA